MSGCYPDNTLSLCTHNVPVKFECDKCSNEHRLNLIESQIKALTDMYKDLSIYVASHSDHKVRQIDENKKISKILSESESRWIFIKAKIEELELLTNALRDKWNSICPPLIKKEPHKCPNCKGTGNSDNLGFINDICNSCDGKGIVWG